MAAYTSWGRHFHFKQYVKRLFWRHDDLSFMKDSEITMLPYGLGRSYGDVCLNEDGMLLDTAGMNHFMEFNTETGKITCEAGVSLEDLSRLTVPKGWFIPVTPGTKFVTIGGAIANDIHGKNHHAAGTFGAHVLRFELVRSTGERLICSAEEHPELYRATIGGLGLTGLITWAEIQLKPVQSPHIDSEVIKFTSLDEFYRISAESDETFEYTVAWVDCLADWPNEGRGLFIRGNHHTGDHKKGAELPKQYLSVPIHLPNMTLNRHTVKLFNKVFYARERKQHSKRLMHYDKFFYPLDRIDNWNRIYGKAGMYQYQFVLPEENLDAIVPVLQKIAESGQASFLAVLKKFGDVPSPGMLSFPFKGITLALDFPNRGRTTIDLLKSLDVIVLQNGGRFYPAKDSIMSPASFAASYPDWEEFAKHIDPQFSSSFWRRVSKS